MVYTTYSRAKNFAPQERKILSYILAKTEPGVPPNVVAKRIAGAGHEMLMERDVFRARWWQAFDAFME